MASSPATHTLLLQSRPLPISSSSSSSAQAPPLRRRLLLSAPALLLLSSAHVPAVRAQDIPLFGLRKKLKKLEEEAEEIVKEGEKAVEVGIEAAEEEASGFAVAGDLIQAAAVAGAEAVGVLVGISAVNSIIGPENS